ncbi:Fanconi anemia group M protein [Patella vulgata]|uniref:Fanconi anemia group M protein n=1 Tax=Patella vulgata TaxID=6465 RepID=UPI0024A84E71|nr:Fanconi anemia group M protein [Patella vulgata]
MNRPKQTTLFQSWGNKKEDSHSNNGGSGSVIDLCDGDDEDDELLAQVLDESLRYAEHLFPAKQNGESTSDGNISFGMETNEPQFSVTVPGFDRMSGKLWIYPTNYPVRDYQYKIVSQALFKNTMVTLPTGLGKTFIASVVMYNYYRWYPRGKIIFMAPTKPLVAQQIEACYNIMGIPQSDTAEMTGNMAPNDRLKAWKEKRVFFLTPQVITNDLSRGSCPAENVKCVVVDEAHKALGNHAYCQVIRELAKYTTNFRVLALSATPGSDIKAVQQVLTNLLISHIEIRTEECPDIKPYTHERKVDKIVVPLGEELTKVKTKYIQIMDSVIRRLNQQKVIYNRPTTSFSKFLLLKSRDEFRQNPPESLNRLHFGIVEGDFALAISLFHGYELLQLHGLRSLYNYLGNILNCGKGYGRTKTELQRSADFNDVMNMLSEKFSKYDNSSLSQKPAFVAGHPKMDKLLEIAIKHFEKFKDSGGTRIMIFSQYRDSVTEIANMLNQHPPMIKAMSFIGQSSAGKIAKGFTQKEQLRVMKEFREGGYNTLVSTCVGEEGLDIGDVDLIICFDAHKSPIRLVQRMGRTGRKREGRIVMLVTEGKEEQIYNQSQYSKKSIHKAILNGSKSLQFYQHNPRMIPNGLTPSCHKMYITVSNNYKGHSKKTGTAASKLPSTKTGSKAKKGAVKRAEYNDITLEEYRELQDYYTVNPTDIKLPVSSSDSLYLTNNQAEVTAVQETSKSLSLSEWLPWQNRLQDTKYIEHSNRSKDLVDLIQFIELQETLGTEEDNYGIEMRIFLNKNDILRENTKSFGTDGIKQYCTSDTDGKLKSKNLLGQDKPLVRKRHSDKLPIIEAMLLSDDSEDELPEFEPAVEMVKQPLFKSVQKKNIEDRVKKKEKASVEKKSISVKNRKRHATEISIIDPITDVDDDFEDEFSMPVEDHHKSDKMDKSYRKLERSIEKLKYTCKKLEKSCEKEDLDISHGFEDDNSGISFHEEENKDIQLPPRRTCLVRTPPPIEEVADIFNSLPNTTKLPHIDLVGLVEEWHLEREELSKRKNNGQESAGSPPNIYLKPLKQKISICVNPLILRNKELDENVEMLEEKVTVKCETMESDLIPTLNKNKCLPVTTKDVNKFTNKASKNDLEYNSLQIFKNDAKNTVIGLGNNIDEKEIVVQNTNTKTSNLGSRLRETDMFNDSMFAGDLTLPPEQAQQHDLDGTQLNLTQALSFLDKTDSSINQPKTPFKNCDKSDICINSVKNAINSGLVKNSPQNNFENRKHCDNLTEMLKVQKSEVEMPQENKSRAEVELDEVMNASLADMFDDDFEVPQFDLGFDLEGDDVIPPTPPPAQLPLNKTVKLSQADVHVRRNLQLQYNTDKQSFNNCDQPNIYKNKTLKLECDKINIFEKIKLKNSPSSQSSVVSFNKSCLFSDRSAMKCSTPLKDLPISNKNSYLTVKNRDTDDQLGSSFSLMCHSSAKKSKFCDKNKLNSLTLTPQNKNSEEPQTFSIKTNNEIKTVLKEMMSQSTMSVNNLFEDEPDMDDFISNQLEIMDNIKKNNMGLDLAVNDGSKVKEADVSHNYLNTSLKSRLSLKQKNSVMFQNNSEEDNEESEEENLQIKRKIRGRKIITSPSSPKYDEPEFKTPTKPIGRRKPKKTCPLNISSEDENELARVLCNNEDELSDELSDDDFAVTKSNKPDMKVQNKAQKKKKTRRCEFIVEEAELSGEGGSSDESYDSDLDQLSGNFINDETQYSSQAHLHDSVDIQAMYLKSVQSPLVPIHGKYRLQYKYKHHDVYSQVPREEEHSEYMEDSFCVDNDYEDSYMSTEGEEDILETKSKGKNKRKKKNLNNMKGMKRLCKLSQSSSEDDMKPVIPLTQHTSSFYTSQHHPKHVKNAFLSSSEDDEIHGRLHTHANTSCDSISSKTSICIENKSCDKSKSKNVTVKTSVSKTDISVAPVNIVSTVSATLDDVEFPNFDLELDLFEDDILDIPNVANTASHKPSFLIKEDSSDNKKKQNLAIESDAVSKCNFVSEPNASDVNLVSEQDKLKQERLERQKLKQQGFKAKLLEQSKVCMDVEADVNVSANCFTLNNTTAKDIMEEVLSEKSSIKTSKLTIIVDSREISGAQDIISNLRLKHDINVEVRQLKFCDYMISTRLAVDRQVWSEFSNGSNHSKLVDRLQKMRDLYDRCCLIIETDKIKVGTEKNVKKGHRSKYVDQTISSLSHSDIRLLFTESQSETVGVLVELCQLEHKKGLSISVPLNLTPNQQQMLKFYLSIPKLTYIQAVNFIHNFKTVSQFLNSSSKVIEIRGKLSAIRATEIFNYINRNFDLQMVPSIR